MAIFERPAVEGVQGILKLYLNTDRDNTIAWSTSGIWFLFLISKWVFSAVYASTRVFSTDALAKVIKDALEQLDEEYAMLANERWWRRG